MRWLLVLLAGCYGPTVATGIPCSSMRDCPTGQVCAANNRCELPGLDGSIDTPTEMPIDASLGPWSAPMKLAELNTMSVETDPSITGDGLDILFASDRPGVGGVDLYRASRSSITQPFGAPVLIMELSTAGSDQAGELTADGLTAYVRIGGDIYTTRRTSRSGAFDTPTLETALSTMEAETNPAISHDGLTFSVTREVSAFDRDLYLHERSNIAQSWGAATRVVELATAGIDSGAAFGANGLVVFFHSDRDSAVADMSDIYMATRPNKNQPFGNVTRFAELATPLNESDPTVTSDLRYIVFECESDLCFATR